MLNLLICFCKKQWILLAGSRVDKLLLRLLVEVFPKGTVLEAGSNSGHLSYRLSQLGYAVTLVDILEEPINQARLRFNRANLPGNFIVSDIKDIVGAWDGVWNSGVVQCYPSGQRAELVGATCSLAPRALFIYPDVSHPNFPKQYDPVISPGVAGCVEYDDVDLVPIMAKFYKEIHMGEFSADSLGLPYPMKYVWGKR